MKALLFINGEPPKYLPEIEGYDLIACTDGAFHYLKDKNFPFGKLDFVSGDFDSISDLRNVIQQTENAKPEIINTPNQDKTDFEKALEILFEKGMKNVDVFGGSGKEMDHFLGNLSVAFRFKNQIEIKFFDDFSEYYFIHNELTINNIKNKMISLYPFPTAENITTKGLNWELDNESLNMTSRIGTRNFAKEDEISIRYNSGSLLIFIGKY